MILKWINCWPKAKTYVQIHMLKKTYFPLFNKRLTVFGQKLGKIFKKITVRQLHNNNLPFFKNFMEAF